MITHLVFAYAVDWGWLHIGPLKCGGNIGIGVGVRTAATNDDARRVDLEAHAC